MTDSNYNLTVLFVTQFRRHKGKVDKHISAINTGQGMKPERPDPWAQAHWNAHVLAPPPSSPCVCCNGSHRPRWLCWLCFCSIPDSSVHSEKYKSFSSDSTQTCIWDGVACPRHFFPWQLLFHCGKVEHLPINQALREPSQVTDLWSRGFFSEALVAQSIWSHGDRHFCAPILIILLFGEAANTHSCSSPIYLPLWAPGPTSQLRQDPNTALLMSLGNPSSILTVRANSSHLSIPSIMSLYFLQLQRMKRPWNSITYSTTGNKELISKNEKRRQEKLYYFNTILQ